MRLFRSGVLKPSTDKIGSQLVEVLLTVSHSPMTVYTDMMLFVLAYYFFLA